MHKYPAVHGNPKTEDRKFIIDAVLKLVLIILLSGQKRLKICLLAVGIGVKLLQKAT